MCGIVGYVGGKNCVPFLIKGLERLEYRGYDSAGIALIQDDNIIVKKEKGKIKDLKTLIEPLQMSGKTGIAHTRWATHGAPSQVNAHPHTSCNGDLAIVHNGIIENYRELKTELQKHNHEFTTETDTEVLVHLMEDLYDGNLEEAVQKALQQVIGTYGIAVLSHREPDRIVVARSGSPLIIGVAEGEYYVASDAAAILEYTNDVIYLEDGELAVLSARGMTVKDTRDKAVNKTIHRLSYNLDQIEKAGYAHFMLKEIHEQVNTIRDTMRGRLIPEEGTAHLGGISDYFQDIMDASQIYITACGTSWHAALIGDYLFEEHAGIRVKVEYASEFRYRNPVVDGRTVVFAISQSGETADTLAAVREANKRGALTIGVVNAVGSTIARETECGVYIHAGPEIGVASTKAFTSQITALYLIALAMARKKDMRKSRGIAMVKELSNIPMKVERILSQSEPIKSIALNYKNQRNFLYLGRGYNYPVALEGALKLKEISYIHAEGYPAAEMKHGPIALIDEDMPVVFIAPRDQIYPKVISNIEEVRARGGRIIAIATEGDEEIRKLAHHVIYIPETVDFLTPLLTVIPLQLIAYYIAVSRGCNVDQPRNLAKSVTVE